MAERTKPRTVRVRKCKHSRAYFLEEGGGGMPIQRWLRCPDCRKRRVVTLRPIRGWVAIEGEVKNG